MTEHEKRYTLKEVAEASGINLCTLRSRLHKRGIRMTRDGMTYADALRLIAPPAYKCTRPPDKDNIERLRKRMKDDGRI